MGGWGPFFVIVYIGIAIFMITLAVRFVNAIENLSKAIEKIADKFK